MRGIIVKTKMLRVVVLCTLALAASAQDQKLVPVPIDVPSPGLESTPVDFDNIPNLEPATLKARPPFLAPPGVENIARGKSVTSSERVPLRGGLAIITDGDATQRDDNYVELGTGVQWIQIDLKTVHEIYGVLVWHYFQPRVYYCVVVQTADETGFTKDVRTWFNNDTANRARLGAGTNQNYIESNEGKLIDTKGVRARYVRLYSAGNSSNDLNHYIEVNVFGRPLPTM